MRIGYLPSAEREADALRKRGYDVSEFSSELACDILLYNQSIETDTLSGVAPSAPLFLLNVNNLNHGQIEEQMQNRRYSKLFE